MHVDYGCLAQQFHASFPARQLLGIVLEVKCVLTMLYRCSCYTSSRVSLSFAPFMCNKAGSSGTAGTATAKGGGGESDSKY